MAFCNSCGATLADGTRFCNKCGAAVTGTPVGAPPRMSPAAPATAPAPPPTTGGSSALKVVLIVIGVIFLIGVLGIGALTMIGLHIAKRTHVRQNGDNVTVETPFGKVESSKDPNQALKDLNVDIYPGAQVQTRGAASATFGNIHTVTAMFESSDSVDKVCSFYKSKFPGAAVSGSSENHCTLAQNQPPNMITINVESSGDGSKFQISSVTKKLQ